MDSKHHALELGERIANLSGSYNVVGFLTVEPCREKDRPPIGRTSEPLASPLSFRRHYGQGLHFVRFPNIFSSTRERGLINEDLT
jgi:hypothetical protein